MESMGFYFILNLWNLESRMNPYIHGHLILTKHKAI
jgi:hypothetical protein